MLNISITLDTDGVLSSLKLDGHVDGASKGQNLACAAVSLTVRSVARLVASCSDITEQGGASEPGQLSLTVISRPENRVQWLKGITDMLLQALEDIAEEYPGAMSINKKTLKEK